MVEEGRELAPPRLRPPPVAGFRGRRRRRRRREEGDTRVRRKRESGFYSKGGRGAFGLLK